MKILVFLFCFDAHHRLRNTFNVNDYGAKGNGTLCTAAIQKTIDAAAANGGGRVIVPAGKYLSGPSSQPSKYLCF